jgi:hypothetical protein
VGLAGDLKYLFDKNGWDLHGYEDKEVVGRLQEKATAIIDGHGSKGGTND